jgi:acyl-CoA thioester hydrolase
VSAPFRHRLRPRYQECDMQGHVYFSRYAEFVDIALVEGFREQLGGWQAMVDGGHDLVVAELALRYRGSAQFDELIDVVLEAEHVGTSSLGWAVRIERDGELLVEGSVRHVCIDPETHAKKPLPPSLRAALA